MSALISYDTALKYHEQGYRFRELGDGTLYIHVGTTVFYYYPDSDEEVLSLTTS